MLHVPALYKKESTKQNIFKHSYLDYGRTHILVTVFHCIFTRYMNGPTSGLHADNRMSTLQHILQVSSRMTSHHTTGYATHK